MGKDWLYWIGGGGGRSSARRRRMPREMREAAATSGGCMRAVFQLFDSPLNHHNNSDCLQEEATASKGLEAPRNSLELDEPGGNSASVLSSRKEAGNLNLPVGIQIKTGHAKGSSRTDDFSSEGSSNCPGIKTPGVVARLMGLDLLPECNSPGSSSSASKACQHQRKLTNLLLGKTQRTKTFFHDDISIGALSLPETPRMSSARRSDFEHHRLSLQINNKENIHEEESSFSDRANRRRRFRFHQQEENRSPSHYAKQIVKQVKESVSRRVGLDITNTIKHTRRDENLIVLKPTNNNSNSPKISDGIKFPDSNNSNKPTTRSPRVSTPDSNQAQRITNPLQEQQQQHKDCKKIASAGKGSLSGIKKLPFQAPRNKTEETFVHPSKTDKKSKKTPLSSDILNISSPILLQAKKDPSPPLTKLPQKQFSSKQSQSYARADKRVTVIESPHSDRNNGRVAAERGGAAEEFGDYVGRILKLAGVVNDSTALTSVKWHAHSQPIDPVIFHRIELFHLSGAAVGETAALSHRCNRKLIFHLVDELLADMLKPYYHFKPWNSSCVRSANRRFPLLEELCRRIDGFPAANCMVLEDIDSLIDKELPKFRLSGNFEEGETIVREIEGEILERLVCETVAMVGRRPHGGGDKYWRMSRAGCHVR